MALSYTTFFVTGTVAKLEKMVCCDPRKKIQYIYKFKKLKRGGRRPLLSFEKDNDLQIKKSDIEI